MPPGGSSRFRWSSRVRVRVRFGVRVRVRRVRVMVRIRISKGVAGHLGGTLSMLEARIGHLFLKKGQ